MLRRVVFWFFLAFVFSSAFSIALSQLALGICAALFVVLAARERFAAFGRGLKWFWVAMGVYIGWLVLVCLLQDEPLRSLDHIREEWLFVLVPVGFYLVRGRENLERVVVALSLGLLLVSVAGLLMLAAGVQYDWATGLVPPETTARIRGNFAHPLTFGNYAALASAFLLTWSIIGGVGSSRWIAGLAMAGAGSGVVAMLLCGSRGPVLGFVAGMVGLLFFLSGRRRGWSLVTILLVVVVVASVPSLRNRFSTELAWHFNPDWPGGRLFIWGRSLEMIRDEPLFGIGPGNFPKAYRSRLGSEIGSRFRYGHAHNDFLQVAARSGIPGALAFGFLWWSILRYIWIRCGRSKGDSPGQSAAVAALLGSLVFLAGSMTEATFADEEVRALLMLTWAIGLGAGYKTEADRSEQSNA